MKGIIRLALVAALATISINTHAACYTDPGTGATICLPPPLEVCELPATRACDTFGVCTCEVRPTMMCEVRILYPKNNPSAAFVTSMGPWCDDAGAELAIAVILAKRLGDPRP